MTNAAMRHIDESKSIAFYNSRPGIRVGGGILIFNTTGDLLLVKPNYRNTWGWPGGGREQEETPLSAAIRECEEEIGICPQPLRPAFVNYIPPRPDGSNDVLHFVFSAKPVEDGFLDKIKLQKEEIEAVKFVPIAELDKYMKPYRVTAINTYLAHRDTGSMLYMEDGKIT